VSHSPLGSRTRPITVNRFANFSPSVDEEIESSILRGLVPVRPAEEGDTVRMPQPAPADLAGIDRPEHGDTVVMGRAVRLKAEN
jgi:CHASE1-domain containing sensor protein